MINIGDTLLIPDPKRRVKHLYVIIGDDSHGNPIAVNVTSTKIKRSTCHLDPGCHPFIRLKSAVNFWDTKKPLDAAALEKGMADRIVIKSVPMAKHLVAKIISEAKRSPLFPDALKLFLPDGEDKPD